MGANPELTAVAELLVSLQKKGENLNSFSESWLCSYCWMADVPMEMQ